jgi:hypothetical protein
MASLKIAQTDSGSQQPISWTECPLSNYNDLSFFVFISVDSESRLNDSEIAAIPILQFTISNPVG